MGIDSGIVTGIGETIPTSRPCGPFQPLTIT